jgi:hypothetical protein
MVDALRNPAIGSQLSNSDISTAHFAGTSVFSDGPGQFPLTGSGSCLIGGGHSLIIWELNGIEAVICTSQFVGERH